MGQIFAIKYINMINLRWGMITLNSILVVLSLLLPLLVNSLNQNGLVNLSWGITLTIMTYFAIYSALVNSIMVGFISKFDSQGHYNLMSTFMVGCSINSCTVLSFQAIILAASPNMSVYYQSFIYFFATSAMVTGCLLAFICVVLKHPLSQPQDLDTSIEESHPTTWAHIRDTYKEIWPDALSVLCVYAVSLTCQPGLILNSPYTFFKDKNNAWLPVFVIGLYNLCDAVGRFLPQVICCRPSKKLIRILVLCRIVLIFTTLLTIPSLFGSITLFQNPFFVVLNNQILLGIT